MVPAAYGAGESSTSFHGADEADRDLEIIMNQTALKQFYTQRKRKTSAKDFLDIMFGEIALLGAMQGRQLVVSRGSRD